MVGDMTSNKKIISEDIVTRNILNQIRSNKKNNLITESEDNNLNGNDVIVITNDPKFGQDVLKNQMDEFKQVVDGGTKFSEENLEKPLENPLVYIPSEENLIFSGKIPSLENLAWQFNLNKKIDSGCFIITEGITLNDDVLQKLNKLYGHYKNWRAQWEQSSGMLENLGKKKD